MQVSTNRTGFYSKAGFHLFLIIWGSALSFLMFHTLEIHSDNVQILEKAYKLLFLGEWSHFGNRGTGVGFVPGSLMTAITALPMKLWLSPYSAGIVIWLSHLASLWLLYDASKLLKLPMLGLFLLLIFWLNPWRVEQMELYNPAYLFFFASLHLWSGLKMKEKNFLASVLHVLSIGLCVQFHFSALILGITSLILLYHRWFKVQWWGFFTGLIIVVASLTPWMLAYLNQPELAITVADPTKAFVGRNFLFVYPVLKAALYWVRYSSTYFARHIFTDIEFSWITIEWLKTCTSLAFHFSKWALALITVFWSLKINLLLLKRARRDKYFSRKKFSHAIFNLDTNPHSHFYRYFCYLFLGMILTAGLSPVEFNHWHLILCFPATAVFLSMALAHRMQRKSSPKVAVFCLTVFVLFSIHNLFATLGSRTHSAASNYHLETMKFFDSK